MAEKKEKASAPEKAEVIAIRPQNCKLSKFENQQHIIVGIPKGTTAEMLEDSRFYANIFNKIRPYDDISYECEEMSFFAKGHVYHAEGGDIRVKIWLYEEIDYDINQVEDRYQVKNKGPHKKFCIVDTHKDDEIIMSGFDKKTAQIELNDWLKSQAS